MKKSSSCGSKIISKRSVYSQAAAAAAPTPSPSSKQESFLSPLFCFHRIFIPREIAVVMSFKTSQKARLLCSRLKRFLCLAEIKLESAGKTINMHK